MQCDGPLPAPSHPSKAVLCQPTWAAVRPSRTHVPRPLASCRMACVVLEAAAATGSAAHGPSAARTAPNVPTTTTVPHWLAPTHGPALCPPPTTTTPAAAHHHLASTPPTLHLPALSTCLPACRSSTACWWRGWAARRSSWRPPAPSTSRGPAWRACLMMRWTGYKQ